LFEPHRAALFIQREIDNRSAFDHIHGLSVLPEFPVEAFLADFDFLSRLIEAQNTVSLELTTFRGNGIDDAAI
jgi:hypothetical protein